MGLVQLGLTSQLLFQEFLIRKLIIPTQRSCTCENKIPCGKYCDFQHLTTSQLQLWTRK